MPYNAECKTVLTFIIPTRKYNRLAKTVNHVHIALRWSLVYNNLGTAITFI